MWMFWWIPALIPLLGATLVLLSSKWPVFEWHGAEDHRQTQLNWQRFWVYLGVNIVLCLLIAVSTWHCGIQKQYFHEVWNMKIVWMRHEAEWTTHETYRTTTRVGKTNVTTTHHYTQHHGPFWFGQDEYGNELQLDQGEYLHWKAVWKTEKQTGINDGSATGWDEKMDGPIYECKWPGTFETICPHTEVHKYLNKIRVSNSILRYGGTPSPALIARFPRPVDVGNTTPVVCYGGPGIKADELLYLQQVNASLGSKYQIHSILVIFGKDADRSMVDDVLTAWQGPNKNELVTFIALDGQQLKWVEVHSWMDNTTLHATLRDALMGHTFSIFEYGTLLRQDVPKLWLRKSFTPINEYLHVSISPGWLILAVVLSIIFGIVSFCVIQDIIQIPSCEIPMRYRRNV